MLEQLEKFLHDRSTFPDLIHAAIAHAQFEAIHPFLDGNGRVGRLLITLELIERKRLSQPLLYLSVFIEAYRQDYYELLQRIRTHDDCNRWRLVERDASERIKKGGEAAYGSRRNLARFPFSCPLSTKVRRHAYRTR
jgi:Fic family protein